MLVLLNVLLWTLRYVWLPPAITLITTNSLYISIMLDIIPLRPQSFEDEGERRKGDIQPRVKGNGNQNSNLLMTVEFLLCLFD